MMQWIGSRALASDKMMFLFVSNTGEDMEIVSAEKLDACRSSLLVWQDPTAFDRSLREVWDRLPHARLFTEPGLTWIREAWLLSQMATILSAESLKLCAQDRPDGLMRLGGNVIPLEVTEVLDPDRRRTKEYKDESQRVRHEPDAIVDLTTQDMITMIRSAIEKKVSKNYETGTSLLVYINFATYALDDTVAKDAIRSAVQGYEHAFQNVFALWQREIISAA